MVAHLVERADFQDYRKSCFSNVCLGHMFLDKNESDTGILNDIKKYCILIFCDMVLNSLPSLAPSNNFALILRSGNYSIPLIIHDLFI